MRTTANPKPNRINARFSAEDHERLLSYCRATGSSVTDALRAAIRLLGAQLSNAKPSQGGADAHAGRDL